MKCPTCLVESENTCVLFSTIECANKKCQWFKSGLEKKTNDLMPGDTYERIDPSQTFRLVQIETIKNDEVVLWICVSAQNMSLSKSTFLKAYKKTKFQLGDKVQETFDGKIFTIKRIALYGNEIAYYMDTTFAYTEKYLKEVV